MTATSTELTTEDIINEVRGQEQSSDEDDARVARMGNCDAFLRLRMTPLGTSAT